MSETPPIRNDQIFGSTPEEYDPDEGEALSRWVFDLLEHQAEQRKKLTREEHWDEEWRFLSQNKQWEGAAMPTYRRPITINIWRRTFHVVLSILLGGRPMLKLVPQGTDPGQLKIWQDALWALVRKEKVVQKYTSALSWALIGDGGWLKVGYGQRDPLGREQPDVMVSAPHPSKIYPDADCVDVSLENCSMILFRDVLDLAKITRSYPEHGWRVEPEADVSVSYKAERSTVNASPMTIAPAGGWTTGHGTMRAQAVVVECWIDDSALQMIEKEEIVNYDPITGTAELRPVKRWMPKYPYGRVITAANGVTLRDISNPVGEALGWTGRWPFVFVPGADQPDVLWRPGLISDLSELNKAINKASSLILENSIKVTNALVIADEMAMDDEDWDVLSLFPGAKIRKRQGTEVKVQFPQPLPPQAFQLPDYLIRKLEEVVGLHDPQITPGQAVAAKTVDFLQRKGSFLMGRMASNSDEAFERLGTKIVALQRDRYLEGRAIPFFQGENLPNAAPVTWPRLTASQQVRVDAGSAWQEIMASAQAMAAQAATGKKR